MTEDIRQALAPDSLGIRVRDRNIELHTPWFEVVSKTVEHDGSLPGDSQRYYSIRSADYATVMPVTEDGHVVLVRQYRPALERSSLEFPSGHVDSGELPEQAIRRELLEETGYEATRLDLVGTLNPDTGRRENLLWCYVATAVLSAKTVIREQGVDVVLVPLHDLFTLIVNNQLRHALDLAVFACVMALPAEGRTHHPWLWGLRNDRGDIRTEQPST
jgi:ADP-ribose diphosphatase